VREFTRDAFLRARPDIWHLHWPEFHVVRRSAAASLWRLGAFAALLMLARLRGTKTVWTAHNLKPHEARHPLVQRCLRAMLFRNLSAFVSLTDCAREELVREYPALRRVRSAVVPHGHYRGSYPDQISRGAARAVLGVPGDARMCLFFGQIRGYKNVPHLVRTFLTADVPRSVLVVAGACGDPGLRAELERAAAGHPRVAIAAEFVRTDRVQVYMRAADLVVLPYTEVLNSGAAMLALSFDRPVLAPARGSFAELGELFGPYWIRTFDGELDAATLRGAIGQTRPPAASERERLERALAGLSWSEVSAKTAALYRSLLVSAGHAKG
jgi:glycosyltransferase involved in cell wall biosynthesis